MEQRLGGTLRKWLLVSGLLQDQQIEADTAFRPGGPAPARAVCPSARLRPTLQPDCLRRKRPGVSQPEGVTALANLAEAASSAGNTTASHTSPKMTVTAASRRSPRSATALSPARREADTQPRRGEESTISPWARRFALGGRD
jgi:hypothetical protein